MSEPGRDGNKLDIKYARGRGNVTAYNANNDIVRRLYEDGLIGVPEREAADYLSKLWERASVGSKSVPELDRIPGQGAVGATDMSLVSTERLNEINRQLSRMSALILGWALCDGLSLNELNRKIGCPKGVGHEKWMVRMALLELAEITGHASKNSRHNMIGDPRSA